MRLIADRVLLNLYPKNPRQSRGLLAHRALHAHTSIYGVPESLSD
jgi:hypothetical protein